MAPGKRTILFVGAFVAVLVAVFVWMRVVPDAATRRAIAIESRVVDLHLRIEKLSRDESGAEIGELIREMAALDPDHPKPYLETARFHALRGELELASAAMESLGPADGPGRAYGEGMIDAMAGRNDEALGHWEPALEAYRELGHLAGQAAGLSALGNVLEREKRYEEALARFEAVPKLMKRLGNRLDLADAYANLANMQGHEGRHAEMAEALREVVAIRRQLGDRSAEARGRYDLGEALLKAGDPAGAVETLTRSLEQRRELGDRMDELSTLLLLANARHGNGETASAIATLAEAAEVADSIDDPARGAWALRRRGVLELTIGQDRVALESFEELARHHRRTENSNGLADAKSWIGAALNRLGQHERARHTLDETIATARELDDRKLEAAALTELGVSLYAVGEIPAAVLSQEEALVLHEAQDNRRGVLTNRGNLGAMLYAVGHPRARKEITRALLLAEEIGDAAARARAHNNLGVLMLAPQGGEGAADPEGARVEFEAAVALWREIGNPRAMVRAAANRAEAELRSGRIEEAAAGATELLTVARREKLHRGEAHLLNVQGETLLRRDRPLDAVESFREALRVTRDHGFVFDEWRSLFNVSRALEAAGRRDEAIDQGLLALDAIDRSRARLETDLFKVGFLAGRLDLYERMIALVLSAGRTGLALEIAERARARGLLDLLAEGRSYLRRRLPGDLRGREESALDEVNAAAVRLASAPDEATGAAARGELERAEAAFQKLQVEIRLTVPEYSDLVYPRTPSFDALRSTLEPGEILLEYFLGRRTSWIWTVHRDGLSVHEVARLGSEELERQVVEMLGGFADAKGALSREPAARLAAEQLARVLLPPSLPDRGDRLIVVPDGVLHNLPFELLPLGDGLLIDRYEVAVVPSASTLGLLREQPAATRAAGFLGIGAPVLATGELPPLPFARREIDRIARLFPENRRRSLVGAEATKDALREGDLSHYRFVHFATHGWLHEDRLSSGLRLSGESNLDPNTLLTLREIPGLDLSADLVVLSACRSGSGRYYRGEGLIGLTRAFLYAGARAVVVSLWEVSDESTAELMEEFYAGLLEGRSAAAALRRAKLGFLHSDRPGRRRPYRWAPFVLVGAPDATVGTNRSAGRATVMGRGD